MDMLRIFFSTILFLAHFPVHALYNGNPGEPELIENGFFLSKNCWASAKIGYQGDYVFNRRLRAYQGAHGRIDDFSYLINQGVATLNLGDRVDIYGSVGALEADICHRPRVDLKRRQYQTNDHITWGTGAQAILFRWREVCLSAEAKYQSAHPRVKWITLNGEAYTTNAELLYDEWQVGVGASRHIDIFTPYAAVTYSQVKARMKQLRPVILNHSHFKMHVRSPFGLALGCSISTSKILDATVEWRLFSEEAVTWAANVKF